MLGHITFSLICGALFVGGAAAWHCFKWYFLNKRRAREEIKMITRAIRDYVAQEGRLPIVDQRSDEQPAKDSMRIVCAALKASGVEALGPRRNHRDLYDNLSDPWGSEYHIAFDRNGDEVTEVEGGDDQTRSSSYPLLITQNRSERRSKISVKSPMAVWSNGPDRRNQCGYGDDVCSWF